MNGWTHSKWMKLRASCTNLDYWRAAPAAVGLRSPEDTAPAPGSKIWTGEATVAWEESRGPPSARTRSTAQTTGTVGSLALGTSPLRFTSSADTHATDQSPLGSFFGKPARQALGSGPRRDRRHCSPACGHAHKSRATIGRFNSDAQIPRLKNNSRLRRGLNFIF